MMMMMTMMMTLMMMTMMTMMMKKVVMKVVMKMSWWCDEMSRCLHVFAGLISNQRSSSSLCPCSVSVHVQSVSMFVSKFWEQSSSSQKPSQARVRMRILVLSFVLRCCACAFNQVTWSLLVIFFWVCLAEVNKSVALLWSLNDRQKIFEGSSQISSEWMIVNRGAVYEHMVWIRTRLPTQTSASINHLESTQVIDEWTMVGQELCCVVVDSMEWHWVRDVFQELKCVSANVSTGPQQMPHCFSSDALLVLDCLFGHQVVDCLTA